MWLRIVAILLMSAKCSAIKAKCRMNRKVVLALVSLRVIEGESGSFPQYFKIKRWNRAYMFWMAIRVQVSYGIGNTVHTAFSLKYAHVLQELVFHSIFFWMRP